LSPKSHPGVVLVKTLRAGVLRPRALTDYQDWAVFCDCDFLWKCDITELFNLRDSSKAVMVVKHDYVPKSSIKMNNKIQYTGTLKEVVQNIEAESKVGVHGLRIYNRCPRGIHFKINFM
jgi:hypothetical protein